MSSDSSMDLLVRLVLDMIDHDRKEKCNERD